MLCLIAALAVPVGVAGCSVKTVAVSPVSSPQSDGRSAFTREGDAELADDDVPFALKLHESLLESAPTNGALLLSACSSFTQYSFAFVQTEADVLRYDSLDEAATLDRQALAFYLRGRDYCLRAMDLRFRGISQALTQDPAGALRKAGKKDVELLYWTAASWGAAIALAPDRPDLLVDFPIVRALVDRAVALDSAWNKGALHEMLITIEGVEALGGSPEKARKHFDQAIRLQGGAAPGPYVALAAGAAVAAQDRAEFEKLLAQALAIDPEKDPSTRMTTLVMQRRAKALRDHADALFSR